MNNLSSSAALLDEEPLAGASGSTAPKSATTAQPAGLACRKCSMPDEGFAVCRGCGYYAMLDKFVEIDRCMEGLECEEQEAEPFRLPSWVYPMIAINVGVVAESVAVALLLPLNTYERLGWSILHLVLGFLCVLVFQIRSTVVAMLDDFSTTVVDCITWPPRAWLAAWNQLPNSSWMFTVAGVGVVSILMSVLVIRSIPYGALLGNGDEKYPKYESLVAKAVEQAGAQADDSEMSMEEAMDELGEATEGQLDSSDDDGDLEEMEAALESLAEQDLLAATAGGNRIIENVRCIVVGYHTSENQPHELSSVVLATASRNPASKEKFEILGTLSVAGQPFCAPMLADLQANITGQPLVQSTLEAIWVRPKIRCEVSYEEHGEEKTPSNIRLQKLY